MPKIWKNITCLPEYFKGGSFEVSNEGVVRKERGRVVPVGFSGRNKNWYWKFSDYDSSYRRNCNKLVATYFLPKVEGKNYVVNIDGNKENNHVDNLKWVTRPEQLRHLNPDKYMPIKKEKRERLLHHIEVYKGKKGETYWVRINGKKVKFKDFEEAIEYRDRELIFG